MNELWYNAQLTTKDLNNVEVGEIDERVTLIIDPVHPTK